MQNLKHNTPEKNTPKAFLQILALLRCGQMRKSLRFSLAAVFGALHAILYFMSFGLWRNWGIYLESIEGIVLGPGVGFLAAFFGSLTARIIRPDPLWMFGVIAEPFSVMTAGFLSRGKWKPVLAVNATMLSAYFVHPFGRLLPIWTILDVLLALFIIYPTAKFSTYFSEGNTKRLSTALVLVSFVSIATDSLVRIFLLIPCGLHNLFFASFEDLYGMFVGAAVSSYIEDFIVVIVSFLVGVPLLVSILRLKLFEGRTTKEE